MEYILAVTLFAISSSVTPGPNNIMVMTSAVNFGIKKSLPLLSGICIGFAIMLLMVGLGFGQLFNVFPSLHLIIKCIGTLYLLYLAWVIARSAGISTSASDAKPLSFMKGALFQWVNAKAWIVATGAMATFTNVGSNFDQQFVIIAIAFLLVSFPCVGVWMLFGTMLREVLKKKSYRMWFNLSMSGLLVLSVIPVIIEILTILFQN